MYTDVVFPKNNEKEFIQIAEKIGYSNIVFVYEKDIPQKLPESKLKIRTGIIVSQKQANKNQNADYTFVRSTGNDRWILEKSKADVLFDLEISQKKDFMHHRASGLNQVLCRIAEEKNKIIAFPFSTILNNKGMLRSQLIGRMMQNIIFCRKFKVKTILASFAESPYQMRSPKDLISFGTLLGMHHKEAKDAMSRIK